MPPPSTPRRLTFGTQESSQQNEAQKPVSPLKRFLSNNRLNPFGGLAVSAPTSPATSPQRQRLGAHLTAPFSQTNEQNARSPQTSPTRRPMGPRPMSPSPAGLQRSATVLHSPSPLALTNATVLSPPPEVLQRSSTVAHVPVRAASSSPTNIKRKPVPDRHLLRTQSTIEDRPLQELTTPQKSATTSEQGSEFDEHRRGSPTPSSDSSDMPTPFTPRKPEAVAQLLDAPLIPPPLTPRRHPISPTRASPVTRSTSRLSFQYSSPHYISSPALPATPERRAVPKVKTPEKIEITRIPNMPITATSYPGCPISLSPKLLKSIASNIHRHQYIASVNCTTGAFEAYLIDQNMHLLNSDLAITGWARGSSDDPKPECLEWSNFRRLARNDERKFWAGKADCLIFVCPTEVDELRERLDNFTNPKGRLGRDYPAKPEWTVVWLGKVPSWHFEFEAVVTAWARGVKEKVEVWRGSDAGLFDSEILVMVRKRVKESDSSEK